MLDLIGEISQSAHWNGFLRRILWISITLCLVRNNHLAVSLSSQSSRLKQWLLIPNASRVNIESRLNIINSIDHEIKTLPEFIIESVFSVWSTQSLIVSNIQVLIDALGNITSNLWFRVSNICLSEQELSIQIWNFNVVIICDWDMSFWWATNTHESKCLNIFTT